MTRRSMLISWLPVMALLKAHAGIAESGQGARDKGAVDRLLLDNQTNPQMAEAVRSGGRAAANAAWWGFSAEDSTAALQAAFDSGAKRVVVPFMGKPWVVRPLKLRSNQEVTFQPGVVILAKKREFLGGSDSLFTALDVSNLSLHGYGATLRMRKKDYEHPPYKRAEWRMGISIRGCKNVRIEGLRVEETGGDGFYIDRGSNRLWSEDIVIRHCVSDQNYRQGISVISAVNLLVEDCVFSNTSGTAPEAGIDLEPDSPDQKLVNCVIRNCRFENNQGHQMLVYLRQFNRQTSPVSIRFENCLAAGGACSSAFADDRTAGYEAMAVGAVKDDGPQGLIEFRNCAAANSCKAGVTVYDKSSKSARVRFVNCGWSDSWSAPVSYHPGPESSVLVQLRRPDLTQHYGGVDFVDCHVFDTVDRPALIADSLKLGFSVSDLRGRIFVHNPFGARMSLGPHPTAISLKLISAGK